MWNSIVAFCFTCLLGHHVDSAKPVGAWDLPPRIVSRDKCWLIQWKWKKRFSLVVGDAT